MVGTNLKAETMALMDKRSALELQMNVIIERLCHPGGPGLSGNLIDTEGFPRSDIDIPSVRADRHRLAEMRNDHKDITEKINKNIEVLHSGRIASGLHPLKNSEHVGGSDNQGSSILNAGGLLSSSNNSTPGDMNIDAIVCRPFAIVDEISEASPAADDGLQLGDQIVKFGTVESGDNLLQKLAAEAQNNVGYPVPMVVMRRGATINLTVTPRTWQGRGMLGCHFRML